MNGYLIEMEVMKLKGTLIRRAQVRIFALFLILSWVSLEGCAGPRLSYLGPVSIVYPENRLIEIELKSFSFQPNHIAILQYHTPIVFRLTNTAVIKHNFTLIDHHKIIIENVDLKPGESITINVKSLAPGSYIFYCNRVLHRRFGGMEGMLMVLGE
jgi:plastocyanin